MPLPPSGAGGGRRVRLACPCLLEGETRVFEEHARARVYRYSFTAFGVCSIVVVDIAGPHHAIVSARRNDTTAGGCCSPPPKPLTPQRLTRLGPKARPHASRRATSRCSGNPNPSPSPSPSSNPNQARLHYFLAHYPRPTMLCLEPARRARHRASRRSRRSALI